MMDNRNGSFRCREMANCIAARMWIELGKEVYCRTERRDKSRQGRLRILLLGSERRRDRATEDYVLLFAFLPPHQAFLDSRLTTRTRLSHFCQSDVCAGSLGAKPAAGGKAVLVCWPTLPPDRPLLSPTCPKGKKSQ